MWHGHDADRLPRTAALRQPLPQRLSHDRFRFRRHLVQADHQRPAEWCEQLEHLPHGQVRVLLLTQHQHERVGQRRQLKHAAVIRPRPQRVEIGRVPNDAGRQGRIRRRLGPEQPLKRSARRWIYRAERPGTELLAIELLRLAPLQTLQQALGPRRPTPSAAHPEPPRVHREARQRTHRRGIPTKQKIDDRALARLRWSQHHHLRRARRRVQTGRMTQSRRRQIQSLHVRRQIARETTRHRFIRAQPPITLRQMPHESIQPIADIRSAGF